MNLEINSKKLATEFEADIKMGDAFIPELMQTRGSGFGRRKKKKVKKKVKKNLLPPSANNFPQKTPTRQFEGFGEDFIEEYFETLDKIYELNPQPNDDHIEAFIPFLEMISDRVAELKVETVQKQYKDAVKKPE